MKAKEIREKYLEFFKSEGHKVIPGASLIPENDPTTLFTTAGMHPLVPFLLGEKHPQGKRLVNIQKCIRTSDMEKVGDTSHHTFFEMLGNWSLGDYWKKEAIKMSFEFAIKELNLPMERIAVTVFGGDDNFPQIPRDEEAAKIWLSLGIPKERVVFLKGGVATGKDNWWGPASETGPCGPSTELFYWKLNNAPVPKIVDIEDDNWVEIWNDVLMEYIKDKDGNYIKASQRNIDNGRGLERMLAVVNGFEDNYRTELWTGIISKIEELTGEKYSDSKNKKAMRIIADHLKAAVFIIGDEKGVAPSNTDQGYIVRRLIRRAIRYGKQLGIERKNWTKEIAKIVISDYEVVYPELKRNENFILGELDKEEAQFSKTLEKGLKEFAKLEKVSGLDAFKLFASYGFPIEMTEELAQDKGMKIDREEFETAMKKHQELSRMASAGKFKGGLADASEETTKLHTAAHLLLAALRKVLGDGVEQKGSNITPERLRFDFSYPEKMTDKQKQEVEKLVNEAIQKKMSVLCEEMSLQEAKTKGATGVFNSKYGERVKVYKIANGDEIFSREICGGPHIKNTEALGMFKIKKEQSSSAGVRRIKAILI